MLANHLTHGFNCGYRIEDIAHQLVGVADLVRHYKHELETGDFMLRYEALVRDPADETRRLLDYLELNFEPACLTFHENPRYAPTPSYAQVAQKLNDRSVGRHQHYAAELAPVMPQLAPLVAELGYGEAR
jgi:hypothetical protein